MRLIFISISAILFGVYYVSLGILVYRLSNPIFKGLHIFCHFQFCNAFLYKLVVISLVIHPIVVETLSSILKIGLGRATEKYSMHPYYDHTVLISLEMIFQLLRRFMFNDANNMNVTILLVTFSGLQEVLLRSTIEWREVMLRRTLRVAAMDEKMLAAKRKFYSYTLTSRSILELVCILISPIMFVFFFPSRFAIDLGYSNVISIDYESILTSTALQLVIEIMVIYCCSLIEVNKGLPMSDFFYQFRSFDVFYCHLAGFFLSCNW